MINYIATPKWEEEVQRITGGKGVDHVIEVGGAKTIMQSVASVRPGGLVSVIGILTEADPIPGYLIPDVLFGAKIRKPVARILRLLNANYS